MTWYGQSIDNPIFVASYNDMINYINNTRNDGNYGREIIFNTNVDKEPDLSVLRTDLYVAGQDAFTKWLEDGGGNTFLQNSNISVDDIYEPANQQTFIFSAIEIWKSVSYEQYINTGNLLQKNTYFCIAVPVLEEFGSLITSGDYGLEPGQTTPNPVIYSLVFDPSTDELTIDAEYFYLEPDDITEIQNFLVSYEINGEPQEDLSIIDRRVSFVVPPLPPPQFSALGGAATSQGSTSTSQNNTPTSEETDAEFDPNLNNVRFPAGTPGGRSAASGEPLVAGDGLVGGIANSVPENLVVNIRF